MGSTTPQPPQEELWRVGEAARYLNAGGMDFRIDARAVRRMADNPARQIRAVDGPASVARVGAPWRWVLASTVRAERARLLAEVGLVDPEWPSAPTW